MRFNPKKFDRFLNDIGQDYQWRRSYACSCLDPRSGSADHRCPVCDGKGRYWLDPVPAKAATASQKTQVRWANMGQFEAGDIVLTVPQDSPLWDAGYYDRIIMMNATDRFSQPLTRNAPSERLIFTPHEVERVFWLDEDKSIVEGGLPELSPSGAPSWPGGEGEPPPGKTYSITGTKRSEYFIFDELPRNRNMHSGRRLPKFVVIRRLDLLNR